MEMSSIEDRNGTTRPEQIAVRGLSSSLDASSEALAELLAIPDSDSPDLWWNDWTDGEYPLISQSRLMALLENIDRRRFLIITENKTGRVCQALGLPGAMTVEISLDVDQVVIAREAEPWSERVNIETYSGIDHPAQKREIFDAMEASFILWQWVTTGVLPLGHIGQEPPESCHRARSRDLDRDQ